MMLEVNIGAYANETHTKLQHVNSLAMKMRGNAQVIATRRNERRYAWLLGYLWGDGVSRPAGSESASWTIGRKIC